MPTRSLRFTALSVSLVVILSGCNAEEAADRARFAEAAAAAWTDRVESPRSTGDWPQLFGPARTSVSAEVGLIETLPTDGPPVLWETELGTGYSSPVVRDGRVIVSNRVAKNEVFSCWEAGTGELLWEFAYPSSYECKYHYSSGPYSTPLIDERQVYGVSADGQIHCVGAEDGKLVWRRSLMQDFEVPEGLFAVGASPLLEGDLLIFNLGTVEKHAGIVALHRDTGETVWTATDHGPGCATPMAATMHGRRYVFVLTNDGLVALAPQTGEVYWEVPFASMVPDSVNATSPLVCGNRILLVTGPGPGALCLEVQPDHTFKRLWRDRRVLDSQFNTLVLVDEHVFGFTAKGQGGAKVRCVDFATGEMRWEWRSPLGRGQAMAADGKLILFGEEGHLAMLRATPLAAEPLGITTDPQLEAACYSAPALAGGLLFLRNERKLVCYDMRAADKPAAASEL